MLRILTFLSVVQILEWWKAYYATYFNFPFCSTIVLNNNSLFKQSSIIYSDSRISFEYTPQHASQYRRDSRTHFRFAQTT